MNRKKVLITGGVGFIGTHLVHYLLEKGDNEITVFDRLENQFTNKIKHVKYVVGDITSPDDVARVFSLCGPFAVVYHLASAMPDKAFSDKDLWKINVFGTANMVAESVKNGVKSFIFTSSNVAYGIPPKLPVTEETPLTPLEIYGKSKAQAEQELLSYRGKINIQIFRCPVVSGIGRLGLQAILFEFISENKNVYVLGDGSNKYQFVDADDVCVALEKATKQEGFDTYNIGADNVLSLKEIYEGVIKEAKSASHVTSLPKVPALFVLSLLDKLKISPLGVYQYTMIGRSLYMDTTKIKKKLAWKPKKTNLDTFLENYNWYIENKHSLTRIDSGKMSSNRSLPKMGIFSLLKMLS